MTEGTHEHRSAHPKAPKRPPPPPPEDDDTSTEGANNEPDSDTAEIIHDIAHLPDRDQAFELNDGGSSSAQHTSSNTGSLNPDTTVGGDKEFGMQGTQDSDEGEWARISDPAYERTGASRIQRADALNDRSVEDHPTPVARAGEGGNDDPRGIEHLTRDQLYDRAKAFNVPGRSKMTKEQLSVAVREAMAVH